MAQKINPISLRLGKTQVWNSILQNYGKNFKPYSKILHKKLQIFDFLNRFFCLHKIAISHIEWFTFKHLVFINVHCLAFSQINYKYLLKLQNNLLRVISKWLFLNVKIYFYFKTSWFSTSNLIIFYIQYLLKRNLSLIKIMQNVNKVLNLCLNLNKISYFKKGPFRIKLIGFKIRLAGRFDNSRNQMAKITKYNSGSLSLSTLKNKVEYSKNEIFTKFGTCGFQIWLFYKIY